MTIAPIRKVISVPQPPQRAFDLFTRRIGQWWPDDIYIGEKRTETMVLEPGVGGRWFKRGEDGSETLWGHVMSWNPPSQLVLAWRIGEAWRYDSNVETELEISFQPHGAGSTVMLEHRRLERLGASAAEIAARLAAGWPYVMDVFQRFGMDQI